MADPFALCAWPSPVGGVIGTYEQGLPRSFPQRVASDTRPERGKAEGRRPSYVASIHRQEGDPPSDHDRFPRPQRRRHRPRCSAPSTSSRTSATWPGSSSAPPTPGCRAPTAAVRSAASTAPGQEHARAVGWQFDADHPLVLTGTDHGPAPVEYVLLGLAACLTAGLANIAAARSVTLHSVESTVEGDIDLQGILGLSTRGPQRLPADPRQLPHRRRRHRSAGARARRPVRRPVLRCSTSSPTASRSRSTSTSSERALPRRAARLAPAGTAGVPGTRSPMATVDTLIIGAGQAGLAVSWHLHALGRDHVVVDRGRIAERWRSERWDSLADTDPELDDPPARRRLRRSRPGWLHVDAELVAHFEAYARSFDGAGARARRPVEARHQPRRRVRGRRPAGTVAGAQRRRRHGLGRPSARAQQRPPAAGAGPAAHLGRATAGPTRSAATACSWSARPRPAPRSRASWRAPGRRRDRRCRPPPAHPPPLPGTRHHVVARPARHPRPISG